MASTGIRWKLNFVHILGWHAHWNGLPNRISALLSLIFLLLFSPFIRFFLAIGHNSCTMQNNWVFPVSPPCSSFSNLDMPKKSSNLTRIVVVELFASSATEYSSRSSAEAVLRRLDRLEWPCHRRHHPNHLTQLWLAHNHKFLWYFWWCNEFFFTNRFCVTNILNFPQKKCVVA